MAEAETPKQEVPKQETVQDQTPGQEDKEQTVEELKTRLAAVEKQRQESNEQFLRLLAEMDNFKKRATKDKADYMKAANSAVFLELLPVIDSLEKALTVPKGAEGYSESLLKGVEITLKQFQKVLDRFGLTSVEALGKVFDPNFHEALTHLETDSVAPDMVAEEVQKGYMLEGRVLRPAMVKVAKAPEKK